MPYLEELQETTLDSFWHFSMVFYDKFTTIFLFFLCNCHSGLEDAYVLLLESIPFGASMVITVFHAYNNPYEEVIN